VPKLIDPDPLELVPLEIVHVHVTLTTREPYPRAGRKAPLNVWTVIKLGAWHGT
jgi:hypothetical protein